MIPIITTKIKYEEDTVLARQKARYIAEFLGFDIREQTSIATAVSEIVRNAYYYAKSGRVEYYIEDDKHTQCFTIKVSDYGPGIENPDKILDGSRIDINRPGIGILGAKRLMDVFQIKTALGEGTTIILGKRIPLDKSIKDKAVIQKMVDGLINQPPRNMIEEVQQQNHELFNALEEIRRRQEDLLILNKELEETNRGVVALYAELDEKAEHLKEANDIKARFLSNMSHEFKTPLNSILALSRLLLSELDGKLNEEQVKQVNFIKKSTEDLSEMVNDLLDIAKVESGKAEVKPVDFDIQGLFSTLRGMLRPLNTNPAVSLLFRQPDKMPVIFNDEGKISQVLRNLVSNALKFTEKGEVIVTARLSENRNNVLFSVSDTGIGIDPQDQEFIFEEFTQVDSEMQKRVKGTGLGLPLSRKLTALLGGRIYLKSQSGNGSIFYAEFPLRYSPDGKTDPFSPVPEGEVTPVYSILAVEDDDTTMILYQRYIQGTGVSVIQARNIAEAREFLKSKKPVAVLLDIMLASKEESWDFLTEIKANELTKSIPVFVVSVLNEQKKSMTLGAEDYCIKPMERNWLLQKLENLGIKSGGVKILIIDDEEIFRYVLKEMLADEPFQIIEADNGAIGLKKASLIKPDVILLDIVMPDLNGFEVIEKLKINPDTTNIPVIIISSREIDEEEKDRLKRSALLVLSKKNLSKSQIVDEVRQALAKVINLEREKANG